MTEIVKTRVTRSDLTKLDRARGDTPTGEWLRNLIRNATQVKSQLHPGEVTTHRHRRGELTDTRHEKGKTINTYRCAEPGCETLLTT